MRQRTRRPARLKLAVAIALGALSPGSAAQAAPPSVCLTAVEREALALRDFQTLLMVSALHCSRLQAPEMLTSYNQFVVSARPSLAQAGDRLRLGYARSLGAREGLRAFDRQMTVLANTHSNAPRATGWCAEAASLARTAAAAEPVDLARLAAHWSTARLENSCGSN